MPFSLLYRYEGNGVYSREPKLKKTILYRSTYLKLKNLLNSLTKKKSFSLYMNLSASVPNPNELSQSAHE